MNFFISKGAADRIKFLQKNSPDKKYFRISVNGGGCSGFMYDYSFSSKKNIDDYVFHKDYIYVIVDELSTQFLNDAKLDFVEELGSSYFQISNPNASTKCGCGNSFSI